MRVTGGGFGAWLRGIAVVATIASAGCSLMPDVTEFRPLPPRNSFFPTSTAAYVGPVSLSGPVAAADLVDAQGNCAGAAQAPGQGSAEASVSASVPRSVGLEMPECEVVRALGAPQGAEVGAENGTRTVVLTYRSGDRPGVYRFFGGRLKSIEQGPDAPQAPAAAKPPTKKPKTAQGA